MQRRLFATVLAGLAVSATAPTTGPRLSIQSFEQLSKPLPLPYDTTADADLTVKSAAARAIRTHKRLLIDLGGNWCLDCRLLAGTIEEPALKTWLSSRFEIITVDIGRFDKNLQIPARYGVGKLAGVPAVLIVDPKTDRLINRGEVAALADARHLSPQGLANWLAKWAKP